MKPKKKKQNVSEYNGIYYSTLELHTGIQYYTVQYSRSTVVIDNKADYSASGDIIQLGIVAAAN